MTPLFYYKYLKMEGYMIFVLCGLSILVGGLGNRMRGGLWGNRIGWGTGTARMCAWSIPVALLCALAGLPLLYLPLMIAGLFLGCCAGQYDSLSMGHHGGKVGLAPWFFMTLWGIARLIIPAILIGFATKHIPWLVIAAFFTCPIIYNFVWYTPPKFFFKGFGYGDGAEAGYDPPELAELIHGIIMSLALVLSI
jgi:hypothetical protein